MKSYVFSLLLSFLLFFSSCVTNPIREGVQKITESVNNEQKVEQTQTSLKTDDKKEIPLPPSSKPSTENIEYYEKLRASLLSENIQIRSEIEEKKKQVEENQRKIKDLEKQIDLEKQRLIQLWSERIALISVIVGILLIVASFFTRSYPLLPRILFASGLILCSISAFSFIFAIILPYILWIALGIIGILFVLAIYYWRSDRKSLCQVVEAVEKYKHEIPDYKSKFRQIIDSDVDLVIDKIREKFKS
ncbi:MAG: hypothetical protein NZZ41_03975 [Candidatus Dojkabacteria bacterium]|nr:hypothetical protein [Candidatus Dojkabacteria bacterium]